MAASIISNLYPKRAIDAVCNNKTAVLLGGAAIASAIYAITRSREVLDCPAPIIKTVIDTAEVDRLKQALEAAQGELSAAQSRASNLATTALNILMGVAIGANFATRESN